MSGYQMEEIPMFKLAALVALGYGAYRFVARHKPDATPKLLPVAGGPLSRDARVQPTPGVPTL